jgi:hypothetical protein
MIDAFHKEISIRRQCELVGLNRSTFYHPPAGESELNLQLMWVIDEQYTKTPFYGWPRMTAHLRRQGYEVNHKRIRRLMRKMGLQAIYPKPRTTIPDKEHKVYPYLLRGVQIRRPNQVWAADITWWPSWTGSVASCLPGSYPTPWMGPSACKPLTGLLNKDCQKSSTRIRGSNSRLWLSLSTFTQPVSSSAWMAGAEHWTISLSNVCGAQSNTRTST